MSSPLHDKLRDAEIKVEQLADNEKALMRQVTEDQQRLNDINTTERSELKKYETDFLKAQADFDKAQQEFAAAQANYKKDSKSFRKKTESKQRDFQRDRDRIHRSMSNLENELIATRARLQNARNDVATIQRDLAQETANDNRGNESGRLAA